jgi:hypothetical protein
MKYMIIGGVILSVVATVFVWALCRVAGLSDQAMEEMRRAELAKRRRSELGDGSNPCQCSHRPDETAADS